MKLDLLVIGAHPDDAEISVGGTILRATRAGGQVGVVDMTRGEMGSRGTIEDRDRETAAASELMGLALRRNMDQPDSRLQATVALREDLAGILRETRPDVVITHHSEDLHPDHCATGEVVRQAWYLAGLTRAASLAGGPPAFRPPRLYHFMSHIDFAPTFVVDVGDFWEQKLAVVRCYGTQLAPADDQDTGEHFLFGADIVQRMETKARYFGEKIGATYGEPLIHIGPMPLSDPLLPG